MCNFTSRNVISPDATLRPNEIDLSYHTFYELFKLRIIYYLMKLDNISMSKAYQIYRNGYNFDERIFNIMTQIIEIEKPMCLVNRNPTLNYYSMLELNIRKVKPDPNDWTMDIPLSILPGLNADQQRHVA